MICKTLMRSAKNHKLFRLCDECHNWSRGMYPVIFVMIFQSREVYIKYHLFLVTTATFLTRRFLSSKHLANSVTTFCLCGMRREGARPEAAESDEEPIISPRQREASHRTSIDGACLGCNEGLSD